MARVFKKLTQGDLTIEITKFTLVGGANFILTFVVFTVLLNMLHTHYLLALAGAWLCGVVFSYLLNFIWVFKPEDCIKFDRRYLKYMISGLISLTLNMVALHILVEETGLDPFYVQVLLMPFVVTFNFVAAKFWSMRKKTVIV